MKGTLPTYSTYPTLVRNHLDYRTSDWSGKNQTKPKPNQTKIIIANSKCPAEKKKGTMMMIAQI